MSVSDPYKVLQVDPEAEDEVIEAAYRRLARKYHPDVSPDPESHDRMIAINQAWEILRDPAKRAAHDRTRARSNGAAAWIAAADAQARTAGQPPATAAGRGQSGPEMRQPQPRPAPAPAPAPSPGVTGAPFGSMSDPAFASAAGGSATTTWTTGRVPLGGFSSGASSRPDGEGAAGPPPGNPSGSVLNFGRYAGWSLGEIARTEVEYLEWLDRMPIGRVYQQEIDEILRSRGLRTAPASASEGRGGPFRRR